MKEIIKAAEETLLAPADLTVTNLQTALQNNMDGLDWADIYAQERMSESWLLEDGKVKTRRFFGGQRHRPASGARRDDGLCQQRHYHRQTLTSLADAACAAKTQGKAFVLGQVNRPPSATAHFSRDNVIINTDDTEKISLLEKIDKMARDADSRVENVIANIGASHETTLIVRYDGVIAARHSPHGAVKYKGHTDGRQKTRNRLLWRRRSFRPVIF